MSLLAGWTRHSSVPIPGPLLRWFTSGAWLFGTELFGSTGDAPQLRYGFTLDTSRAQQELGFQPGSRIGFARAGDGTPRAGRNTEK